MCQNCDSRDLAQFGRTRRFCSICIQSREIISWITNQPEPTDTGPGQVELWKVSYNSGITHLDIAYEIDPLYCLVLQFKSLMIGEYLAIFDLP